MVAVQIKTVGVQGNSSVSMKQMGFNEMVGIQENGSN